MVIYSVLRVLLFAVAAVVLYLVGMRGWLLVLVAAVVALAVSYLALQKPREAAAVWLAERSARRARTGERFSRSVEDDAALEDAAVDAAVDADAQPTGTTDSTERPARDAG